MATVRHKGFILLAVIVVFSGCSNAPVAESEREQGKSSRIPAEEESREARVARLNAQAEAAVGKSVFRRDTNHHYRGMICNSIYLNARHDQLGKGRGMEDLHIARMPVCFEAKQAGCGSRVRDDLARFVLHQGKSGGCVKDHKEVRSLGHANGTDIVNDRKEPTTLEQANFQADLYDTLFRAVTIRGGEVRGAAARVNEGVLEILISERGSGAACPNANELASVVDQAIDGAARGEHVAAVNCGGEERSEPKEEAKPREAAPPAPKPRFRVHVNPPKAELPPPEETKGEKQPKAEAFKPTLVPVKRVERAVVAPATGTQPSPSKEQGRKVETSSKVRPPSGRKKPSEIADRDLDAPGAPAKSAPKPAAKPASKPTPEPRITPRYFDN